MRLVVVEAGARVAKLGSCDRPKLLPQDFQNLLAFLRRVPSVPVLMSSDTFLQSIQVNREPALSKLCRITCNHCYHVSMREHAPPALRAHLSRLTDVGTFVQQRSIGRGRNIVGGITSCLHSPLCVFSAMRRQHKCRACS